MKKLLIFLLIVVSLSHTSFGQTRVIIHLKDYQGQKEFNSIHSNCEKSRITIVAKQKGYEKIELPQHCIQGKTLPDHFVEDLLQVAGTMKRKKVSFILSGKEVVITRKKNNFIMEFSI